jgi:hypothetical protein
MGSPYRSKSLARFAAGLKPTPDRDLLVVLALLWITSVAVVIKCIAAHHVLGPEATVALIVVFLLPRLAFGGWLLARPQRRRTGSREVSTEASRGKGALISRSPFKDTP